jgi:hypothetical protein
MVWRQSTRETVMARMFACIGVLVATTINPVIVLAQPSASCSKKFLGEWRWTASSGLQVNVTFLPSGEVACTGGLFGAACHMGTWDCSGRQLFSNHPVAGKTTLTLSADGSRMTGIGGIPPNPQIVVRLGAPPSADTTYQKDHQTICATPPPGTVRRTSPSYECITVRNPNSDLRCVYFFTYRISTMKRPLPGGNIPPGESREQCSLQEGVDIAFDKWTLASPSAR